MNHYFKQFLKSEENKISGGLKENQQGINLLLYSLMQSTNSRLSDLKLTKDLARLKLYKACQEKIYKP